MASSEKKPDSPPELRPTPSDHDQPACADVLRSESSYSGPYVVDSRGLAADVSKLQAAAGKNA